MCHEKITIAHEHMCKVESLEFEKKIDHFDIMIKEAAQALKLGMGRIKDNWVREFVQRGQSWDSLLQDILSD